MKLCKDCKYFWDGWIGDNYFGNEVCKRPTQSMVYGIRPLNENPEKERSYTISTEHCGQEGTYFEHKNVIIEETKLSLWDRIFK